MMKSGVSKDMERALVNYEAETERILQEEVDRKRAIKKYSERNKERIREYDKNRY